MKKLLVLLLAFVLVLSFAACDSKKDESSKDTTSTTDSTTVATSATTAATSASTAATTEPTASATESSTQETTGTTMAPIVSQGLPAELANLPLIKLMQTGTYGISVDVSTMGMTVYSIKQYVKDNKMYSIMESSFGNTKNIVADGYTYSIDDETKTFMKYETGETSDEVFDFDGEFTIKSISTVDFNGKEATSYDMTITSDGESSDMTFCVADGDFVGIIAEEEGTSMQMSFSVIDEEITDSLFEIPADYTEGTDDTDWTTEEE